jgi:hypothetical protein
MSTQIDDILEQIKGSNPENFTSILGMEVLRLREAALRDAEERNYCRRTLPQSVEIDALHLQVRDLDSRVSELNGWCGAKEEIAKRAVRERDEAQAALSAARERIREMEALFPTNRHLHEEAAGMGLEDAFFRMNGIDPDARPAPSSRVAGEGLRPWQRFDGAPKDGSTFLALHSAWKVPVAIKWHPGASGMEGCDWITGTMDQTWPSIAFSGWMPMPDSLRAAKPSP